MRYQHIIVGKTRLKYIIVESELYTSYDYDNTDSTEIHYNQTYEMFPVESIVKVFTRCCGEDWVLGVVVKDEMRTRSENGLYEYFIIPSLEEYKGENGGKRLFSKDAVQEKLIKLQNCLNNGGLY